MFCIQELPIYHQQLNVTNTKFQAILVFGVHVLLRISNVTDCEYYCCQNINYSWILQGVYFIFLVVLARLTSFFLLYRCERYQNRSGRPFIFFLLHNICVSTTSQQLCFPVSEQPLVSTFNHNWNTFCVLKYTHLYLWF